MKITHYTLIIVAAFALELISHAKAAIRTPAQITFRVITDEGKPVAGVDVTASTFLRWQPGEGFGRDIYEDTKARTDKDGLAVVRFDSERGDCGYGIYNVSGYYSTRSLQYQFSNVKNARWEPWSPVVDLVLKPILNPIPLYGRKVGELTAPLTLPSLGKPCGFDLIGGDWVKPYGKGLRSDLIFTLHEIKPVKDIMQAFEYRLEITFSNEGDGLQSVLVPLLPHEGSDLRLPRYAPASGYEAKLVKQIGRPADGEPMYPSTREDQNYFVRVRTVLDEKGNIKSALYGKILGDISCFVGSSSTGLLRFAYCLNPTSLDRNLEFDPKKNLFGDLNLSLRVSKP